MAPLLEELYGVEAARSAQQDTLPGGSEADQVKAARLAAGGVRPPQPEEIASGSGPSPGCSRDHGRGASESAEEAYYDRQPFEAVDGRAFKHRMSVPEGGDPGAPATRDRGLYYQRGQALEFEHAQGDVGSRTPQGCDGARARCGTAPGRSHDDPLFGVVDAPLEETSNNSSNPPYITQPCLSAAQNWEPKDNRSLMKRKNTLFAIRRF